jgi:hypothetical protein
MRRSGCETCPPSSPPGPEQHDGTQGGPERHDQEGQVQAVAPLPKPSSTAPMASGLISAMVAARKVWVAIAAPRRSAGVLLDGADQDGGIVGHQERAVDQGQRGDEDEASPARRSPRKPAATGAMPGRCGQHQARDPPAAVGARGASSLPRGPAGRPARISTVAMALTRTGPPRVPL